VSSRLAGEDGTTLIEVVISSAILGAGSSDRFNSVRWSVARGIGIAWVLTLPAAGLVAALSFLLLRPILG